jgi:plastocyanin
VTRIRRGSLPLQLLIAALLVAGCADDGNDAVAGAVSTGGTSDTSAPTTSGVESPGPTAVTDPVDDGSVATGVVVTVIALDNSFRPQVVEIEVGDEVIWENRGQNEHNVLEVDGDDWGVVVDDFQPGARYSHVFDAPGTYRYFCSIHGTESEGMVGTIVVS